MNLRTKLRRWWHDWTHTWGEPQSKVICWLRGHDPDADQCGIPDHDFCYRCGKPMPGMAPGRQPQEDA